MESEESELTQTKRTLIVILAKNRELQDDNIRLEERSKTERESSENLANVLIKQILDLRLPQLPNIKRPRDELEEVITAKNPRIEIGVSAITDEDGTGSETYTDYTGVDLTQFFISTLKSNTLDMILLLQLEAEMVKLLEDPERSEYQFPPASSYKRMLIHRVAAYFCLDHSVKKVNQDETCVIVRKNQSTRLPATKFKELITEVPGPKSCNKRCADDNDNSCNTTETISASELMKIHKTLGDKLSVLSSRIVDLEKKETEHLKDLKFINRKKSDIADLNTDLKANIQALKKQNDASDKELNKSKCIIQNYRDKVQTMEEQISKFENEVKFLTDKCNNHQAVITSTEQEQDKARMSEELSKSRDRVKSLQMIGKNYRDKSATSEKMTEKLQEEVNELKKKVLVLSTQNKTLEGLLDTTNKELDSCKSLLGFRDAIDTPQTRTLRKENNKLRELNTELELKCKERMQQVVNTERRFKEKLENKCTELVRKEKNTLEENHKLVEETKLEKERMKNDFESKITKLKNENCTLMGMTREEQLMQKHELTKQVQAMNLEAKRSKILLDLANSDKEKLEKKLSEQSDKFKEKTVAMEEIERENQKLQVQAKKDQISRLKKTHEEKTTMTVEEKGSEASVGSDVIRLKVVREGKDVIQFKVKQTTPIGKMKKAYSKQVGIPIYSLRFLWDGQRINDDDTPEKMEMEEGDIIEAYLEQKGGIGKE